MNLQNDKLQTPDWILKELGEIDLDPCAGENTNIGKVNFWDGRGEDGLNLKWNGFVYCNPPFSKKEIWIEKMIDHNEGILLLPERGSAPWFSPLADACKNYFVMGKKINFIGGSSSNNVGSVLFLFGNEALNRIINCNLPGHLVNVNLVRKRI